MMGQPRIRFAVFCTLANARYVHTFLDWIDSLHLEPGQLYGWPDYVVSWSDPKECACKTRRIDDEKDGEESERSTDNGRD